MHLSLYGMGAFFIARPLYTIRRKFLVGRKTSHEKNHQNPHPVRPFPLPHAQPYGCGGAPSDSAAGEKLTVGVVQLIDNGAFEDMREGFTARLKELGYTEDKCEIYYKNAQGDAANLNAICQEMVDKDVDLIAAIATRLPRPPSICKAIFRWCLSPFPTPPAPHHHRYGPSGQKRHRHLQRHPGV